MLYNIHSTCSRVNNVTCKRQRTGLFNFIHHDLCILHGHIYQPSGKGATVILYRAPARASLSLYLQSICLPWKVVGHVRCTWPERFTLEKLSSSPFKQETTIITWWKGLSLIVFCTHTFTLTHSLNDESCRLGWLELFYELATAFVTC